MKTGMEISRRHTSPQSPTINQLSLIQFKHNTMEISWIWIFYLNPHPTVLIYIHFYLRNSLKCYLAMCKKVTKKNLDPPLCSDQHQKLSGSIRGSDTSSIEVCGNPCDTFCAVMQTNQQDKHKWGKNGYSTCLLDLNTDCEQKPARDLPSGP